MNGLRKTNKYCYIERFKKIALEESKNNSRQSKSSPKFAFSALIIGPARNIISIGHNNPSKTHPRSGYPGRTIHAELSAILRARPACLKGCSMVIARTSPSKGLLGMARPCRFCLSLLQEVGISKVWHTTRDGNWEMLKL